MEIRLTYSVALDGFPVRVQRKFVNMIVDFQVTDTALQALGDRQFFIQTGRISRTSDK